MSCDLETGLYAIYSTVDTNPLDICRDPPGPREPVVVSDQGAVVFFVDKLDGPNCTYYIRVSHDNDHRFLRNVDGVVTASEDRMIPQEWVINNYGEGTYTIVENSYPPIQAWTDSTGTPGCGRPIRITPKPMIPRVDPIFVFMFVPA